MRESVREKEGEFVCVCMWCECVYLCVSGVNVCIFVREKEGEREFVCVFVWCECVFFFVSGMNVYIFV